MHVSKVISTYKLNDEGKILFLFCVSPAFAGVSQRAANMLYCDVVSFRKTKISCPSIRNGVFEEEANTECGYVVHLC